MSCLNKWKEQYAAFLARLTGVAPESVDAAPRCIRPGCNKLIVKSSGRCLAGHTQEGRNKRVEPYPEELDGLTCVLEQLEGEKRLTPEQLGSLMEVRDFRIQARSEPESYAAGVSGVAVLLGVLDDLDPDELNPPAWVDADPRVWMARVFLAQQKAQELAQLHWGMDITPVSNAEIAQRLAEHQGHRVVCATYGDADDPVNISIECETCGEVIEDFEPEEDGTSGQDRENYTDTQDRVNYTVPTGGEENDEENEGELQRGAGAPAAAVLPQTAQDAAAELTQRMDRLVRRYGLQIRPAQNLPPGVDMTGWLILTDSQGRPLSKPAVQAIRRLGVTPVRLPLYPGQPQTLAPEMWQALILGLRAREAGREAIKAERARAKFAPLPEEKRWVAGMFGNSFKLPLYVWTSGHTERGVVTGGTRPCGMEGCRGTRICVRWPNGKRTWPCSKGLTDLSDDEWQIG